MRSYNLTLRRASKTTTNPDIAQAARPQHDSLPFRRIEWPVVCIMAGLVGTVGWCAFLVWLVASLF